MGPSGDVIRRALEPGSKLARRFLLLEFRADWPALHSSLGFPFWNAGRGMCFKCSANLRSFKDLSPEAPWRHERYSHDDFLGQNLAGKSPVWSCPGFEISCVRPDWLHVMDEGVSKDFAGGALSLVLQSRRLGTKEETCTALTDHLQRWYETAGHEVLSKYDRIIPNMLQGCGGSFRK